MKLAFILLPLAKVLGIYTVGPVANRLPDRLRQLAWDAGVSFMARLVAYVVVSDMRRTPEQSFDAIKRRKGSLPPGRSGHGFGWSIDIHVPKTIANLQRAGYNVRSKRALDDWMAQRGWYCHRADGLMELENWHYNFLDTDYLRDKTPAQKRAKSPALLELQIQRAYGEVFSRFASDVSAHQRALATLKLYNGAVDGDAGPRTRSAISMFQRMMGKYSRDTGKLSAMDARMLCFCGATTTVTPWEQVHS